MNSGSGTGNFWIKLQKIVEEEREARLLAEGRRVRNHVLVIVFVRLSAIS
jgi:hypothetical protein